jgi:hypothetical protein
MGTRRQFLTAAAALAVAPLTAGAAEPVDLRPVLRKSGGAWVPVRMRELRPGDVARFDAITGKAWKVVTMPLRQPGGGWGVGVEAVA